MIMVACLALEAIMKDQVEQLSLLFIGSKRGELGIQGKFCYNCSVGKVQNMDPLSWTESMDPLFLIVLKIVVIKDYKCVVRLGYNLNLCLLLKSLSLAFKPTVFK